MKRNIQAISPKAIKDLEKQLQREDQQSTGRSPKGKHTVDVVTDIVLDETKKELRVTKRPLVFEDGILILLGDLKHSRVKLKAIIPHE